MKVTMEQLGVISKESLHDLASIGTRLRRLFPIVRIGPTVPIAPRSLIALRSVVNGRRHFDHP